MRNIYAPRNFSFSFVLCLVVIFLTIRPAVVLAGEVMPPGLTISGSSTACAGSRVTYTYNDINYCSPDAYFWTVSGGTIVSYSYGTSITVEWNMSTGGIGRVNLYREGCGSFASAYKSVTITGPAKPTVPTQVQFCARVEVTRAEPPTGHTWYWQETATGKSTANSAKTYTVYQNRTVYLRSYNGCWSDAVAVPVTIQQSNLEVSVVKAVGIGADVSTRLTAQVIGGGTATYSWSPATGLDATSGPTVKATPTTLTTYTVTATNAGGCSGTVQVTVGPNNYNYVASNTITKAGITTDQQLQSLTVEERKQTVAYFDGLGRELQTVVTQGSPSKKDMVQPFSYDALGRTDKSYLPYTSGTNGFFKTDALVAGYQGSAQQLFYQQGNLLASDAAPYAVPVYEPSPLGRIKEQGAAGVAWQPIEGTSTGKTIRTMFRTNQEGEVRSWEQDQASGSYFSKGYYSLGELYVTEIKDEQEAVTVEYKDKQGRLVLRKVQEDGTGIDAAGETGFLLTHYVYDGLGNLVLVIQPEGYRRLPVADASTGNIALEKSFQDRWCFRYRYDGRRRVIEKQVPGAGPVQVVYNRLDQVVLSQDANQGAPAVGRRWSFTKYDVLGRPIMAGELTDDRSRATLQDLVNQGAIHHESRDNSAVGYTLTHAFPSVSSASLLSVTYYDDYNYTALTGFAFVPELGHTAMNDQVRGQVTAMSTRTLGLMDAQGQKTEQWLTAVNYYDDRYRLIQTLSDNHLGGQDRTTTRYKDLTSNPEETFTLHQKGTEATYLVRHRFTYDHTGRLLKEEQKNWTGGNGSGGEPADFVLLAKSFYNELGQLVDKELHSTDQGKTFLQSVDMRYNIRGWLTSINNRHLSEEWANVDGDQVRYQDLFGLELKYNQEMHLGTQPQHNGNIAEALWMTASDKVLRGYGYAYDKANRLTSGRYRAWGGSNWGAEVDNHTVSGLTYDGNGNIRSLVRHGLLRGSAHDRTSFDQTDFGPVDQLAYNYVGNRLALVSDGVTPDDPAVNSAGDFSDKTVEKEFTENDLSSWEYQYDANGNMTADANKGITVTYNHLNLVERVDVAEKGYLTYTYAADGRKLRKQVYEITDGTAGPNLKATTDYAGLFVYQQDTVFAHTSEGRVLLDGDRWRYEYQLKDHLGNLRVTFGEPQTTRYLATMEEGRREEESLFFSGFGSPDVRVGVARAYDHTHKTAYPADEPAKVVRLNAARGALARPMLQLRVLPGDTVLLKVHAKYVNLEQSSVDASVIAGALLGTATGYYAVLDGSTGSTLIRNSAGSTLATLQSSQTTGMPNAGLSYFLLDEKGDTIQGAMGYVAVNSSAAVWDQASLTAPHQELALAVTNITQPGFIHIEVGMKAGAGAENIDLYFDDLEVEHRQGILLQENHYDPWGLNLAGIERQNTPDHKFQYLGREKQVELGLQWLDLKARNYDPQLGRFHSVDPLADEEGQESWTSYHYGFNNPVLHADPDGKLPIIPIVLAVAAMVLDASFAEAPRSQVTPQTIKQDQANRESLAKTNAVITTGVNPTNLIKSGASAKTLVILSAKSAGANRKAAAANAKASTPTSRRVTPRKGTIEKVKENQPRNENGEMIDPDLGTVLKPGQTDLGHKYGEEWKTRKKMHEAKGSTRKEVIEAENNPSIYQYEDRSKNRSHKYEKKN